MKTNILVIGVIRKGDAVLLRKKPDGSAPYKETWYLFGGQLEGANINPERVLIDTVKIQTGIDIIVHEKISWDTEIKPNHEGEQSFYIYLDCICEYVSGELVLSEGIEKLEWVHKDQLKNYDLVPPAKKLFNRLDNMQ